MILLSDTVYCAHRARFYKERGFAGVSYDTKLAKGEWYFKDRPFQINKPLSEKAVSKF